MRRVCVINGLSLLNGSGPVYCHTHFRLSKDIMAIFYMCRRLMLGQRQHLYILQIHQRLLLVLVSSPVRFTMLTETIPLYFCLITQCPGSYLHHFLGKSLAEAMRGQSSCDIGWCLYGTMYARRRLPNHLNYSVDCHCTLDWLGMESSYYCTCGGTINLFHCWGAQLILARPALRNGGLLLKSERSCHCFVML